MFDEPWGGSYPFTAISRDGDGTYRLTNLPPGDYELGLGSRTDETPWVTYEKPRLVHLDENGLIEGLELRWPVQGNAQTMGGRILSADGSTPVKGTQVEMLMAYAPRGRRRFDPYGDPRRPAVPRTVITDDQGQYRMYPVEPEWYLITASTPDGRKSEPKRVVVGENFVSEVDFEVK